MHTVSSLCVGGMEQFVIRLAAVQIAEGHRATVVALSGGPLEETARASGVPHVVLGGRSRYSRYLRGALVMSGLHPQVVNAHNPTSLHYAMLGKRLAGAKVVMTDHNANRQARQATRAELLALDAAVGVSGRTAANLACPELDGKVCVIHNGVTVPAVASDRATVRMALSLPEDRMVAIMVGRLAPGKGHACLLSAVAELRDRGTPLTLVLAGDGPERGALEARAAELGLGADALMLLGYRRDIPDLVAASDIFAFSSEDEGLPLSILEAMALGCPIATTPVGGIPEVLADETEALFFPVNDRPALVRRLERLCRDPGLRFHLAAAARARCLRDFTFSAMAQRYEDLYRRLLGRR